MSALIFRLFINGLQKRVALVCTRGKRGEDGEKMRALARLPGLHLI